MPDEHPRVGRRRRPDVPAKLMAAGGACGDLGRHGPALRLAAVKQRPADGSLHRRAPSAVRGGDRRIHLDI